MEILPGTMQVVYTGYSFKHIFSGYGVLQDRSSNYMEGVRVFKGVLDATTTEDQENNDIKIGANLFPMPKLVNE